MHAMPAALYARGSSTQQAEAHTVARQVGAVRERIASDGLPVPEALQFIDEGDRGAPLVRPAVERVRDLAVAGAGDRRSVPSPDRLARKSAAQVLLVDAFPRAGVEVIFLSRELGRSPDDDLRLQGHGMMAEDERAKMIDRHRRGTLHAARAGTVNGRSGAPYGDRSMPTDEGQGQARDEAVPDDARVVRPGFDGVGRQRWTSGAVCRRLPPAGDGTRPGQTVWDRSVVWGRVKTPASQGMAAVGKTPQGPLRPRRRAQRRRPLPPRRAIATDKVPPAAWRRMPGPARVEPELCAAVPEQVQEHQRHARQSPRGALDLLQGLVPCQPCGYADDGNRLSPSARTGHPRA
jgi:site-specific DNA recombinase